MSFDAHLSRLAREDPDRFRVEVRRVHPEWFEPLECTVKLELGEMSEGAEKVVWDAKLGGDSYLHVLSSGVDPNRTWDCCASFYNEAGVEYTLAAHDFSEVETGGVHYVEVWYATLQSAINAFITRRKLPPMIATLSEDWGTITLTEVDADDQKAQD